MQLARGGEQRRHPACQRSPGWWKEGATGDQTRGEETEDSIGSQLRESKGGRVLRDPPDLREDLPGKSLERPPLGKK